MEINGHLAVYEDSEIDVHFDRISLAVAVRFPSMVSLAR
jgi:hypothetical protein